MTQLFNSGWRASCTLFYFIDQFLRRGTIATILLAISERKHSFIHYVQNYADWWLEFIRWFVFYFEGWSSRSIYFIGMVWLIQQRNILELNSDEVLQPIVTCCGMHKLTSLDSDCSSLMTECSSVSSFKYLSSVRGILSNSEFSFFSLWWNRI